MTVRRRRLSRLIFSALCLLTVAACGGSGPKAMRVSIQADEGANDDSPVAVSAVVIYDKGTLSELRGLSAEAWFEQVDQRIRDNPEGQLFDLLRWEIFPGQAIEETTLDLDGRPVEGGLVFARYLNLGEHREFFDPAKRIIIRLEQAGFRINVLKAE